MVKERPKVVRRVAKDSEKVRVLAKVKEERKEVAAAVYATGGETPVPATVPDVLTIILSQNAIKDIKTMAVAEVAARAEAGLDRMGKTLEVKKAEAEAAGRAAEKVRPTRSRSSAGTSGTPI